MAHRGAGLLMQAQNLLIRFSSKCQGRNVCWFGFVVVGLIKLFDRQSIDHYFKDKHFQILKVGMKKKFAIGFSSLL